MPYECVIYFLNMLGSNLQLYAFHIYTSLIFMHV